MKLPSLSTLLEAGKKGLSRFPLTLFISFLGVIIAIYLFENNSDEVTRMANLLHVCIIGIGLSISGILLSEAYKFSGTKKLMVNAIVVAMLGLYYFLLPDEYSLKHIYRSVLLAAGIHLFISFIPFWGKNKINGFWQFNKLLFIRILLSGLYSAVLYGGLSVALLAISELFSVTIDGKLYGQLWIAIVGLFNTWFFLSGIPDDFESLEEDTSYPIGLKVFTQYVLLPLVTIYLAILFGYIIKIVIAGELPKGLVSYLVLAFSVAGILSLLLVHPLINQAQNTWIKIYSKFFYLALLPLITLLFTAIFIRIIDYGITENRYFIMILAFWLLGITLFMLFSKVKNIKVIPVSLMIIAVLSAFGPWSAFSVSQYSQKLRLENLFNKYQILNENGKISIANSDKIAFSDGQEISSIIDYLVENHGVESLSKFSEKSIMDSLQTSDRYGAAQKFMFLSGLKYYNSYDSDIQQKQHFNYSVYYNETVKNIKGYDYILSFNLYDSYPDSLQISTFFTVDSVKLDMYLLKASNTFHILYNNDTVAFNLQALVKNLDSKYTTFNEYNIPSDTLTIVKDGTLYNFKAVFTNLNGYTDSAGIKINSVSGDLLIAPRK